MQNDAKLEEETKQSNLYWNNVNTIINSGDLKGITIPNTERTSFSDYVSKDVTGKGQSQEMVDKAKEDLALSLQLSYMRFKGFKLDDLIKVKAGTLHANTLSERRKGFKKVTAKKASSVSKVKGDRLAGLTGVNDIFS